MPFYIAVVLLGSLLMRKVFDQKYGIAVGTQPLSLLMEEKMRETMVPTAILSMDGELKSSCEDNITLSAPVEEILAGKFQCLMCHAESICSSKVRM